MQVVEGRLCMRSFYEAKCAWEKISAPGKGNGSCFNAHPLHCVRASWLSTSCCWVSDVQLQGRPRRVLPTCQCPALHNCWFRQHGCHGDSKGHKLHSNQAEMARARCRKPIFKGLKSIELVFEEAEEGKERKKAPSDGQHRITLCYITKCFGNKCLWAAGFGGESKDGWKG